MKDEIEHQIYRKNDDICQEWRIYDGRVQKGTKKRQWRNTEESSCAIQGVPLLQDQVSPTDPERWPCLSNKSWEFDKEMEPLCMIKTTTQVMEVGIAFHGSAHQLQIRIKQEFQKMAPSNASTNLEYSFEESIAIFLYGAQVGVTMHNYNWWRCSNMQVEMHDYDWLRGRCLLTRWFPTS